MKKNAGRHDNGEPGLRNSVAARVVAAVGGRPEPRRIDRIYVAGADPKQWQLETTLLGKEPFYEEILVGNEWEKLEGNANQGHFFKTICVDVLLIFMDVELLRGLYWIWSSEMAP